MSDNQTTASGVLAGLPIDEDIWSKAETTADFYFMGQPSREMLRGYVANAIMAERIRCYHKVAPIPLSVHATDLEKQAHDVRAVLAAKIWSPPK